MNEINIICSHDFRLAVKDHKRYELDLGRRYTKRTNRSVEMDIRDPFVLKIYTTNKVLIYKVGRLGAITLYTYSEIPDDEVWIYINDTCYVRPYVDLEMSLYLDRYLSKLVGSAEEEHNGTDKLD